VKCNAVSVVWAKVVVSVSRASEDVECEVEEDRRGRPEVSERCVVKWGNAEGI
jgi:hypothetical protein